MIHEENTGFICTFDDFLAWMHAEYNLTPYKNLLYSPLKMLSSYKKDIMSSKVFCLSEFTR